MGPKKHVIHSDNTLLLTFRHGFWLISNEALNARRWAVVKIVRGLFGPRRPSCRILPLPLPPTFVAGLFELLELGTGLAWLFVGTLAFSPKIVGKTIEYTIECLHSKLNTYTCMNRIDQVSSYVFCLGSGLKKIIYSMLTLTCLTTRLNVRFVVGSTEETTSTWNVFFTFFELTLTHCTCKTLKMIHMFQRSHHQLIGMYRLFACFALGYEMSTNKL